MGRGCRILWIRLSGAMANAADANDENVVIIQEPDIAALYIAEFERRWAEASVPDADNVECP